MTLRGTRFGIAVIAVALLVAGCGPEPFEPDGAKAVEERARSWSAIDRALAEVQGDREPIAQARYDGCHTGQNNWKIKDKYAHECSVLRSLLVPAAELDDVSEALQTLSRRLDELGCTATWRTLAHIDQEYWTKFQSRPDYRPGSLPEAGHQCGEVRITVKPTDSITIKKAEALLPFALIGLDQRRDEQPYPADTDRRAEADGAAMFWMITADQRYYATKF
ncbi:hypothetical protein [Microlunatus speluncae]|uniref:hypothetical protein n=1 Tax=Microlunatus speluncae TaxID=2594267 RepID=UPI0012664428|nr:hypothetical protein [Microlunatus speluncae]